VSNLLENMLEEKLVKQLLLKKNIMSFNKNKRRLKIRKNIRSKIFGTNERPRISIFKSNKAIYSQIIDDNLGLTLVSCSSNDIGKFGKNNIDTSKEVGIELAQEKGAAPVMHEEFEVNAEMLAMRPEMKKDGHKIGDKVKGKVVVLINELCTYILIRY